MTIGPGPGRAGFAAALIIAATGVPGAGAAPPASGGETAAMGLEIAPPRLPGRLEGGSFFYFDDHGLYVSTTGAEVEHPLGGRLALRLRALGDWIGIYPPSSYAEEHGHHLPGGGHHDPGGNPDAAPDGGVDGISGASARAGSSGESQEGRAEGGAGLVYRGRSRGRPLVLAAESRASYEPDYQSVSAAASGSLETFRGNTVWSGHAGAGWDRIDPGAAVTTRGETWPAGQAKASAGGAVSQTLTPRLVLTAGASGAWLLGRLSSPYRRALIVTTLFPERLPSDRLRLTGFVQAGCHLGRGLALHSRQGFYWDTWDVKAWVPETALAKELGAAFLLTLKHRAYVQRPADFYRTGYSPQAAFRTGDPRLGGLEEQTAALEIDWRPAGSTGAAGGLVLTAGYSWSYLEYWSLPGHALTSQVARLGAALEY